MGQTAYATQKLAHLKLRPLDRAITSRYYRAMNGGTAPDTPPPSDPFNGTFSEWLRLSVRAVPAFVVVAVLWLPVVIGVRLAALSSVQHPGGIRRP